MTQPNLEQFGLEQPDLEQTDLAQPSLNQSDSKPSNLKQVSSPKTPALWNLLRWTFQPLNLLETSVRRYGDCFSIRMGNFPPLVFLSDPQAIEQIFTSGSGLFDSGRANWILRLTVGDNSLLLLDGDRHQRHRQLLMPPFHGERMRAYGQLICQITERVTNQWQVGKPFAARPLMQEISLEVILEAVFGLTEGDRSQQLKRLLGGLLEVTGTPIGFAFGFFPWLQKDYGPWSLGGRFNRLKQEIDQLIYAEIEERRAKPDPARTDILTLLLSARDEADQPMTNVELRDELMTLLLAGHETTATAIAWALYWIHALPEVKTRLLAELETLGDNPESLAIARLPYLNAVCSETLRIYPVGLVTEIRIPKTPIQITDYQFEAETFLAPCIYLTHHRPDLYPEPDRFIPERFLERQFSPYEYLPFGGSNRRCIGAAFALFEMKLVLATVLSRYQLALAEKRPVVPVRRGVTLAPKGGVRLVVTGERSAQAEAASTLVSAP